MSTIWALLVISILTLASPVVAKTNKLKTMMILGGTCSTLIVHDQDVTKDCTGKTLNTGYADGRTGFYFIQKGGVALTFSGIEDQVKTDENTAIQPIDLIILNKQDAHAVGYCRFTNPYNGPAIIECQGYTKEGFFQANFKTDGKEPDVQNMQ